MAEQLDFGFPLCVRSVRLRAQARQHPSAGDLTPAARLLWAYLYAPQPWPPGWRFVWDDSPQALAYEDRGMPYEVQGVTLYDRRLVGLNRAWASKRHRPVIRVLVHELVHVRHPEFGPDRPRARPEPEPIVDLAAQLRARTGHVCTSEELQA